jgi:ABC-2 type transport system permease protein
VAGNERFWIVFYLAFGLALVAIAGAYLVRTIRNGLLRKELGHFFASPIAWLVMAGFAFVTGYVFLFVVQHYAASPNEPLPDVLFNKIGFFWILQFIVIPATTMRLIAEERATGTLETLMTAPVTDAEVVFAKFAAAMVFYVALWTPTLVHLGTAYAYGVPEDFWAKVSGAEGSHLVAFFRELNATMDFGPIFSAYLGIFLMGSAWISVGLLTSAFSRNQVIAFVAAFVATIMSYVIGFAGQLFPSASPKFHDALRYVSFQHAFEPFPRGLVDSRSVVFFLTITLIALFLSVRIVESRKWR